MTLSAEEQRGLLEDAADPRRREVLARFRLRRANLSPHSYLQLLEAAASLLEQLQLQPRRRHPPGPGRLLL